MVEMGVWPQLLSCIYIYENNFSLPKFGKTRKLVHHPLYVNFSSRDNQENNHWECTPRNKKWCSLKNPIITLKMIFFQNCLHSHNKWLLPIYAFLFFELVLKNIQYKWRKFHKLLLKLLLKLPPPPWHSLSQIPEYQSMLLLLPLLARGAWAGERWLIQSGSTGVGGSEQFGRGRESSQVFISSRRFIWAIKYHI